jgi:hypothetical protein
MFSRDIYFYWIPQIVFDGGLAEEPKMKRLD